MQIQLDNKGVSVNLTQCILELATLYSQVNISSIDLLKKMPGFRDCYRLAIQVFTLLVRFPLSWIWKKITVSQMVARDENRKQVEQEDQEGKS